MHSFFSPALIICRAWICFIGSQTQKC